MPWRKLRQGQTNYFSLSLEFTRQYRVTVSKVKNVVMDS